METADREGTGAGNDAVRLVLEGIRRRGEPRSAAGRAVDGRQRAASVRRDLRRGAVAATVGEGPWGARRCGDSNHGHLEDRVMFGPGFGFVVVAFVFAIVVP